MRFHWTPAGLLGWILYESTGKDGIDRSRTIRRFPACRIIVAKVSKVGFTAPNQLTWPAASDPKDPFATSMKSGYFKLASWIGALAILVLTVVALPTAAADSPKVDDSIQTDKDTEMADWTFDQAENVACITVRQVIDDREPILLVFHDSDDHSWQFLSGGPITEDDAMVVSMRQVVEHDPTLLEIGTMPPGYRATRKSVSDPWHIEAYAD